jgi:hypothetical protein
MDANQYDEHSDEALDMDGGFVLVGRKDVARTDELSSRVLTTTAVTDADAWLQATQNAEDNRELTRNLGLKLEGTGRWVFDSPDFKQWYERKQGSVLWIRGMPSKDLLSSRLLLTFCFQESQDLESPF